MAPAVSDERNGCSEGVNVTLFNRSSFHLSPPPIHKRTLLLVFTSSFNSFLLSSSLVASSRASTRVEFKVARSVVASLERFWATDPSSSTRVILFALTLLRADMILRTLLKESSLQTSSLRTAHRRRRRLAATTVLGVLTYLDVLVRYSGSSAVPVLVGLV